MREPQSRVDPAQSGSRVERTAGAGAGRVLSAVAGTACIAGALLGTTLVVVANDVGLSNFDEGTGLLVGLPAGIATLATGVFAIAYAITGERRLLYPHLAAWAIVALILATAYATTGYSD